MSMLEVRGLVFASYFNTLRELVSTPSPVGQGSLRVEWASILLSQVHATEKTAKDHRHSLRRSRR